MIVFIQQLPQQQMYHQLQTTTTTTTTTIVIMIRHHCYIIMMHILFIRIHHYNILVHQQILCQEDQTTTTTIASSLAIGMPTEAGARSRKGETDLHASLDATEQTVAVPPAASQPCPQQSRRWFSLLVSCQLRAGIVNTETVRRQSRMMPRQQLTVAVHKWKSVRDRVAHLERVRRRLRRAAPRCWGRRPLCAQAPGWLNTGWLNTGWLGPAITQAGGAAAPPWVEG